MTRHHDLPPRWDGHPVAWDPEGWKTPDMQPHICHIREEGSTPLREDPDFLGVCPGCGMSTQTSMRRGRITTDLGDWILYVFRCTRCGHDQVTEHAATATGWSCWDLDPDDYTDTGSYERTS